MNLLDLDARWRRLNTPDRACPCCGRRFEGIYDIGFDAPEDWPHATPEAGDMIETASDRLTAELCRLDGQYHIRATLALPIRGSDEVFFFAPWVEVPKDLFDAYLDCLDGGTFLGGEGLLSNDLPGFDDSLGSPVTLIGGAEGERPQILPQDPELHEASQGLSFDGLLDLYAAFGDDLRPHLAAD